MATAGSAGACCFLEVQEGVKHTHSGVHPVVESVLTLTGHSGVITRYQLHGVGGFTCIHCRRVKRQTHAGRPGNPA